MTITAPSRYVPVWATMYQVPRDYSTGHLFSVPC